MRAELIERLRSQLGAPFPAEQLKAALSCAAFEIAQLTLCQAPGAVLVLNTLTGEQLIRAHTAVHSREKIDIWHIPEQICASCAQAAALAFVASDLEFDCEWESCPELNLPNANDILLQWSGPEIKKYAYVIAADSTGRSMIGRALVIGMLTGTFRLEYRRELVKPLIPIAFTEPLRLNGMYRWPG